MKSTLPTKGLMERKYYDNEFKLSAFFHELAHVVDDLERLKPLTKYMAEARAWEYGYELAKKEGIVFSDFTLKYNKELLSTYKKPEYHYALHLKTKDLPFSSTTQRRLRSIDADTIGDIIELGEERLANMRWFGEKTIKEIKQVLKHYKLKLPFKCSLTPENDYLI